MLLLHGTMLAAPVVLIVAHAWFRAEVPGVCVFKAVFGHECPACGMTRAVMALLSGQMTEALYYHPAAPFIFGLLVVMTVYLALILLTGRRGLEWRQEVKAYNRLELVALIALLVGWVGKMFTH